MSKHTPGPWKRIGPKIKATRPHARANSFGAVVAEVPSGGDAWFADDVVRANADLIAAAPDLLAALSALVEQVRPYPASETDATFKAAEAAIKKARGGQ